MKTSKLRNPYFLLIIPLLLLAFTTGDSKSEYNIPKSPYSISVSDIDNNGENDLIFGHNFSQITQWSGISILQNSTGYFSLFDSINLYGWQPDCQAINLNQFITSEIIAKKEDPNLEKEFLAVIYDLNFSDINYFDLNTYEGVDNITIGDLDDFNGMDVIISSYNAKFWGFLINDGQGNLSPPIYHNLNFSPTDIKSGKLNEDNFDDIAIGGADFTIKFSQGTGFQTLTFGAGVMDIEIADLDNDGDNDIVGFDDLYFVTQVTFFENTGNSTFYAHDNWEFTPGCYYLTVSDFNNDSLPDLFFHANSDNGMYIYYNLGGFEFDSPEYFPFTNYGESSRRSASADFDNNGFNDLVIVRSLGEQLPVGNVTILFNDGNGNFVEDPITEIKNPKSKNQIPNLVCYPNPFKTETTITFSMDEKGKAQLQVFDLNGKLVQTITNKELQKGKSEFKWNGTDKNGKRLQPGIYMIHLTNNNTINQTCKLVKH